MANLKEVVNNMPIDFRPVLNRMPSAIGIQAALWAGGILLGLLLVSIALNILLFNARDTALANLASQKELVKNERAVSQLCSENTEKLRAAGERRAVEAANRLRLAEGEARKFEGQAQKTMQQPPSDPTNACQSAVDLNAVKLRARRAK